MRALAIALTALLLVAGCNGNGSNVEVSDEFCEAARKLDAEIEATERDPAAQIELLTPLVDEAPPEIRADAQTWLDALKQLDAGDESVKDDPEVEDAVVRVERVAQNQCDLLGGGGSPFG